MVVLYVSAVGIMSYRRRVFFGRPRRPEPPDQERVTDGLAAGQAVRLRNLLSRDVAGDADSCLTPGRKVPSVGCAGRDLAGRLPGRVIRGRRETAAEHKVLGSRFFDRLSPRGFEPLTSASGG